jgi:hypothetical protein
MMRGSLTAKKKEGKKNKEKGEEPTHVIGKLARLPITAPEGGKREHH